MPSTFYIKQDDTQPPLEVICRRGGVSPGFDPVNDSVTFSMRDPNTGTVKVNAAAAVIVDEETLRYTMSVADTDTPGNYDGEFEVTYSGGEVETYPNAEYITVRVVEGIT